MGRAPCCEKGKVKRGPWSPEEDNTLKTYLEKHGTAGNWIALPRKAGLNRCGKSCRLRWLNYLRPDIKHGGFTEEEDSLIWTLYNNIGSRWSIIASQLPGRTDNDVKNYWNTKLKKKLLPSSMVPKIEASPDYSQGKSLSYFDVDAIDKTNDIICSITSALPNNDLMMQQQNLFSYHPIGGDDVELFEFGSSVSSSTMNILEASTTDPLSSSSTIGMLPDQNNHDLVSWNANYYDGVHNSNNGSFMEYMGFDSSSSSDFVLSGFGF